MRTLAPLIMIVLLVGFIIKFIWWILGAAALVGLFYLVRAIVRADRAAREARARLHAEVVARADQQHRWVLDGDDRGIYGPYPVPAVIKELRRGIRI